MTNESKITTKWWQDKSPVARMYLCDQYFHHRDWESLNQSQIQKMWTQESKKEGLYAGFPHIQKQVESILGPDSAEFLKFEAWLSGLSEGEVRKLRELYYPGENLVNAAQWMIIYAKERPKMTSLSANPSPKSFDMTYTGIYGAVVTDGKDKREFVLFKEQPEVAKQTIKEKAIEVSEPLYDPPFSFVHQSGFIAGANWQAEQDKAEIEQMEERIRIKTEALSDLLFILDIPDSNPYNESLRTGLIIHMPELIKAIKDAKNALNS